MSIPGKPPAQLVQELDALMDRLAAAGSSKANKRAINDLAKLRAIHATHAERIREDRRDHHRHMRDVHLGLAAEHQHILNLLFPTEEKP
jgi:hypothetical protein